MKLKLLDRQQVQWVECDIDEDTDSVTCTKIRPIITDGRDMLITIPNFVTHIRTIGPYIECDAPELNYETVKVVHETGNIKRTGWLFNSLLKYIDYQTLDIQEFNIWNLDDIQDTLCSLNCRTIIMPKNKEFKCSKANKLFYGNRRLKTIEFNGQTFPNLKNAQEMFALTPHLSNFYFNELGFSTEKLMDLDGMYRDSGITKTVVDNFKHNRVLYISQMFRHCSKLVEIDMQNFESRGLIQQMDSICAANINLKTAKFGRLSEIGIASAIQAFECCGLLHSLDVHNINTKQCYNFSDIFNSCRALKIDPADLYMGDAVSARRAFFQQGVEYVDIQKMHIESLKVADKMFAYQKIKKLVASQKVELSELGDATEMFYGCDALYNADISNVETPRLTIQHQMFGQCIQMKHLRLNKKYFNKRMILMNQIVKDTYTLGYDCDISDENILWERLVGLELV